MIEIICRSVMSHFMKRDLESVILESWFPGDRKNEVIFRDIANMGAISIMYLRF